MPRSSRRYVCVRMLHAVQSTRGTTYIRMIQIYHDQAHARECGSAHLLYSVLMRPLGCACGIEELHVDLKSEATGNFPVVNSGIAGKYERDLTLISTPLVSWSSACSKRYQLPETRAAKKNEMDACSQNRHAPDLHIRR